MKKLLLLFSLLLFFGCSNNKFDSEKWKTQENEQFYMLNDIVENKLLFGKTKNEIIALLGTKSIKNFKYAEDSWMFIILIPNSRATQSPVENMYIDFENGKVNGVYLQK